MSSKLGSSQGSVSDERGSPFTRFRRLGGERGELAMNFVAKLEIGHLQEKSVLHYSPLVVVDEGAPSPRVLQQPADAPRRKENRC